MALPIKIVQMTEKEIPQVAQIEAATFSTPWSAQGFLDTLYQDNIKFFLAMHDDAVVGYCGLYMAADEGEITNVAVDTAYRRQNIADMLLDAMLEEGIQNGIRYFYLEVRVTNEPAIRLYEKHGFEKQGVRKNFYTKPTEDAFVMCKIQND